MKNKSILETAQDISNTILSAGIPPDEIYYRQKGNYYYNIVQAIEDADQLTKFAYEEQRVEEILKKVIEKNKAVLIELIKQENALVKEEEQALQAVQKLKELRKELMTQASGFQEIHIPTLQQFHLQVNRIIDLLEKDAQIEQALSVVTSDLALLLASLNTAKQIRNP